MAVSTVRSDTNGGLTAPFNVLFKKNEKARLEDWEKHQKR